MSDSAVVISQVEFAPACPGWCSGQHLQEAAGFDGAVHHDSAAATVQCARRGREDLTRHLYVGAHREDRPAGRGTPSMVSIAADTAIIAELTADEAVRLARQLLNAAALVEDG